jgi:hypothetical protein
VGTDTVFLALTLLAIGVLLTYLGARLIGAVGVRRPVGKTVSVLMITIWGLSLATFEIGYATYVVQLCQQHMIETPPVNPISPITILSALGTFIIILYLARHHRLNTRSLVGFLWFLIPLRSNLSHTTEYQRS